MTDQEDKRYQLHRAHIEEALSNMRAAIKGHDSDIRAALQGHDIRIETRMSFMEQNLSANTAMTKQTSEDVSAIKAIIEGGKIMSNVVKWVAMVGAAVAAILGTPHIFK